MCKVHGKSMNESETINVPASSARAFEVRKGSLVKIVDIEGQQVGDFVAFMLPDLKEKFSAGRTRIENSTLRISRGNQLLSNVCNPMFTIMEDTCRVHDLLYPPCSRWVFEHRYKVEPHDGCLENLARTLAGFGLTIHDIPDPFNVFMNARMDENFKPTIMPPISHAGDYIVLHAHAHMLVGLSACAVDAGNTNAGRCKPLRVELTHPRLS